MFILQETHRKPPTTGEIDPAALVLEIPEGTGAARILQRRLSLIRRLAL
jgi:hypothetical protein